MRFSFFLVLLSALACGKKSTSSNANLASEGADAYASLEAEKAPDDDEDIIAEIPAVISGAHLTCTPRKAKYKSGASELSCAFSPEQAQALQDLAKDTKLEIVIDNQLIVLEVTELISSESNAGGFLVLEIDDSDLEIMKEKVREDETTGEEPTALTLKDSSEVLIGQISTESGGFQVLSEEFIETEAESDSIEEIEANDESSDTEPAEQQDIVDEESMDMPEEEEEPTLEEAAETEEEEAEESAKVVAEEEEEVSVRSMEMASLEAESEKVSINLVSNSSFELDTFVNPVKVGDGYYEKFEDGLIDWEKSLGTVIELQRNMFGWKAAEGNGEQWVELCSTLNSGITQDITTIPGETYTLSFFFAARPLIRAKQNHLMVEVDGKVVFDKKKSGRRLLKPNWEEYFVDFVAENSKTSLEFYSAGCTSNFGTFIDQIRVIKSSQ